MKLRVKTSSLQLFFFFYLVKSEALTETVCLFESKEVTEAETQPLNSHLPGLCMPFFSYIIKNQYGII